MSIRSDVVLPAPFGPSRPEHLTAAHLEGQVADGDEAVLVGLGHALEAQRHVLAVGLDGRDLAPPAPAPELGRAPAEQAEAGEDRRAAPTSGRSRPSACVRAVDLRDREVRRAARRGRRRPARPSRPPTRPGARRPGRCEETTSRIVWPASKRCTMPGQRDLDRGRARSGRSTGRSGPAARPGRPAGSSRRRARRRRAWRRAWPIPRARRRRSRPSARRRPRPRRRAARCRTRRTGRGSPASSPPRAAAERAEAGHGGERGRACRRPG